jgi:arylsulfatase A-like enzyme
MTPNTGSIKKRLKSTALAAALILITLAPGCQRKETAPRHLILVSLDTVRQDHLSVYGYYRDTGPGLEALARESITFTRAYTPLPSTWPAHFSLMTSRPPPVIGVLANGQRPADDTAPMLAEMLSEQGFLTAAVIGSAVFKPPGGIERGFGEFDNRISTKHDPARRTLPNKYARGADEVVDRSIDWIASRDPNKRFFLWMHFWDAHGPYFPPPEYRDRYKTDEALARTMRERSQAETFNYMDKVISTEWAINNYDGAIRFIDDELGRFWRFLRKEGIYDGSLIIIFSDHGEGLNEHGIYIHGPVIYQTSVHVPLIIRLPRAAHGGKVIDSMANLMDLAPTALELLEAPELPGAFGQSLAPLIKGKTRAEERSFMLESVYKPHKGEDAPERMFGVVDSKWKYIRFEGGGEALFDLEADPNELENVSETHRKQLIRMRRQLSAFREEYDKYAKPAREITPEMKRMLEALGY